MKNKYQTFLDSYKGPLEIANINAEWLEIIADGVPVKPIVNITKLPSFIQVPVLLIILIIAFLMFLGMGLLLREFIRFFLNSFEFPGRTFLLYGFGPGKIVMLIIMFIIILWFYRNLYANKICFSKISGFVEYPGKFTKEIVSFNPDQLVPYGKQEGKKEYFGLLLKLPSKSYILANEEYEKEEICEAKKMIVDYMQNNILTIS